MVQWASLGPVSKCARILRELDMFTSKPMRTVIKSNPREEGC